MTRFRSTNSDLQISEDSDDKGFGQTAGKPNQKRKIIVLVALIIVAGIVVGSRFLKGKSPQQVAATPAFSSSAPPSCTLDNLFEPADAQPQGMGDLTSASVDDLVKWFCGHSQEHQIPLDELQVDPFEVVLAESTQDEQTQKQSLFEQAQDTVALGGILVGSASRLAVLDGRICREGDVVRGYAVKRIGPETVELIRGEHSVTLNIKHKAAQQGVTGNP